MSAEPGTSRSSSQKNRRSLLLLSGLVVGMLAFGFAMVPLYGLICKVTGVQSVELRSAITPATATPTGEEPVSNRLITVKFDTNVHPELPWDFKAKEHRLEVQPGKMYAVDFEVRNRASRPVIGQAIASVAPWQASGYFSKLECFCFQRQPLRGGEAKTVPLRFMVLPDLPSDINSLTLSYIFMNTGEKFIEKGPDPSAKATAG